MSILCLLWVKQLSVGWASNGNDAIIAPKQHYIETFMDKAMLSSQILISGLASGGLILLIFLLLHLLSFSRRLWRKQPVIAAENKNIRFGIQIPLLAPFSDAASLSTSVNLGAGESRRSQARRWRWLILLLLVIAVGVDILAEATLIILFDEDPHANILLPILGIVFAGVIFAFICTNVEGNSFLEPFKAILPKRTAPPVALWLTNLVLSLVPLTLVDIEMPNWMHYLLFSVWLFNILLFCWNIAQLQGISLPDRETVEEWWRTHRLEVLLLVLIGLAALLIRVIGLETYPYAFITDEAEMGWEGQRILSGESPQLLWLSWFAQPELSFLPVAFFIKLFGHSAYAVRLASALQGTLAVICLYLLAREVFDRPVAFFAACLLAALPWHVHFSRLGLPNISDSFFSTAVLWLTFRALRHGRYTDYLLAGLMAGFALYTYVGTRLVVGMAIGLLGYTVLRQRDYLWTHLRQLTVFILALVIVASPVMFYFSNHIDRFLDQWNAQGILTNNRLEQYATDQHTQPFDFLLQQMQTSSMAFIALPSQGSYFDTPQAYLPWWAAVFFLLGMVYTFWRFKEIRYMMLLGWFWAPIVLGSALTIGPPSHQRMLSAAPALVLITALGLWKFVQSFQRITRLPVSAGLIVCILFVGFTVVQNINLYFVGEFRTEHRFESPSEEFSYEVGMRAQRLGPDYQLLLIGEPDIFSEFATFHYVAPESNVDNFNQVIPESIASLPRDRGLFFAAIPSRVDDLRMVAQLLPGGEWIEVSRRTQDEISYYAYILPPLLAAP